MWENAVITNSGNELLSQWANGGRLTIDRAATGYGTVNSAYLMAQTALVAEKQTLAIVEKEGVEQGIRLRLQCTNDGIAEEYTINQVGIWAHIDNGASVLLAIYQDEAGVLVPLPDDVPDFVFTFYAVLEMSNKAQIDITMDPSAVVTQDHLEEILGGYATSADLAAVDSAVRDIISGDQIVGKAAEADTANTAQTAQKAIEDENGNNIVTTYATKSEIPETSTININGEYKNDPSFYAPIDSGEAGQILTSNGEGEAPTWKDPTDTFPWGNIVIYTNSDGFPYYKVFQEVETNEQNNQEVEE